MSRGVSVESLGAAATAARPFSVRGTTFLTTVVKVTVALVQDAPMQIAKPTPIVRRDQRREASPSSSVRRPSDVALVVPRPEIVLDAIAFAPKGGAERVQTRLAAARGTTILLSKHIEVVGDRKVGRNVSPGRPATFENMPIVYERSLGGPGRPENPVGVGISAGPDGVILLPNLMAGEGTRSEPPGYGAISREWPLRRQKRGSLSNDVDDLAFAELPPDFGDDYFQAAPDDQQVAEWRPGDLLAMTNLHPEWRTLRVYVPQLRAVALLETLRGARTEVTLRVDTIFLEPHLLRGELVFRGATPMPAMDLEGLRITGAVDEPGFAVEWPNRMTTRTSAPHGAPGFELRKAPRLAAEGTLVMEGEEKNGSSTLVLEPAGGEPPAPGDAPHVASSTLVLETESTPTSLPFAPKLGRSPSSGSVKAARESPPVPGAPWSPTTGDVAVPARGDSSRTLVLDDEPPAREAIHLEPAPLPSPTEAKPPSPAPKKRNVWREDPAAPANEPVAKVPEKKSDSRDSLYKKFK